MTIIRRTDGNRPWAPIVGYSRAVRMGNLIEVSGTSSTTHDGQVMHPNDAYGQMRYILNEIEGSIKELGATFENTIRTRVYMTSIDDWPAVAKAHGKIFASILPVCTFIEVSRLMLPELCVEVEATLWVFE
ncbi:MAG: Rid family hydrolase [Candidatus Nanopelagicaceae bacterium]|nr:Rid family hydrolase [Candidatus Nanopelagicaceae bacterium]